MVIQKSFSHLLYRFIPWSFLIFQIKQGRWSDRASPTALGFWRSVELQLETTDSTLLLTPDRRVNWTEALGDWEICPGLQRAGVRIKGLLITNPAFFLSQHTTPKGSCSRWDSVPGHLGKWGGPKWDEMVKEGLSEEAALEYSRK